MSVGFSPADYSYVAPKKDVKKDGFRAGCVGALALGAGTLGTQYFVQNSTKAQEFLIDKITDEAAESYLKGRKFTPWTKIGEYFGRTNWVKAGKIALVGGTIIGLAAALNSAMKKLPDETNYYA